MNATKEALKASGRRVKLAVVQMSCSDVLEENLSKAERFVREAAQAGANIVLLQELFENLYFPQLEREDLFALAHPVDEHPFLERFGALAGELGVVLPVSFFERANQAYFNSLMMFDADGSPLGVYRKSHIPDGPATRRSTTSTSATPRSRRGGRASARSAWRSAGTSGFPRSPA